MTISAFNPRSTPYASVQGTLALDLSGDEPWGEELAAVLQLPSGSQLAFDQWIGGFVRSVVEIACGTRPVAQVLRHTSREVYLDLARRAQLVARAVSRSAGEPRPHLVTPHVASVRTTWVRPEVAEVCVRVRHGKRSRAVALRIERISGRWQATALEFA